MEEKHSRDEFFEELYRHCEGGFVEFRIIPNEGELSRFFVPLDKFKMPTFPSDRHSYFGLATRETNKDGTKANILQIPALWCDIDFKETPEGDANDLIRHGLNQPSAMIRSGGGFHLYWFLKEPLSKEDIPQAENILKRLVQDYRGDMQSAEAAHVLRVPGTWNVKPEYKDPRQVRIETFEPSLQYDPSDFDSLPELKAPIMHPQAKVGGNGEGIVLSCPAGVIEIPSFDAPIPYHHRDKFLFHIMNQLSKSGTARDIQYYIGNMIARHCDPPFPEKEMEAKIKSAMTRGGRRDENITREIRNYIDSIEGIFTTSEMYRDLGILQDNRGYARVVLNRLKGTIIEPHGDKSGAWRKIDDELEKMDLSKEVSESLPLWLPLDIHSMVNFKPGNIILIAGDVDAGKTAFLLNVIKGNVDRFKVHYFNSEMGEDELISRLQLFDDFPKCHPNFNPYTRSENFAEVIRPGKDNLNVVDYLEIHDEFFKVGKLIKDIHVKLRGALAIIALQKKSPDSPDPLGGQRGLEKPRLAISISKGRMQIRKAKNWRDPKFNPNGREIVFKLARGCMFTTTDTWRLPRDYTG